MQLVEADFLADGAGGRQIRPRNTLENKAIPPSERQMLKKHKRKKEGQN